MCLRYYEQFLLPQGGSLSADSMGSRGSTMHVTRLYKSGLTLERLAQWAHSPAAKQD